MKQFKVKTKFVFSGVVEVEAETALQAKILVENNMGACGPDISDSGCSQIIDWNFDYHADTEVEYFRW